MAIDPMDPAGGLETQLQLATSLADPSRYPYVTPFQAALAPMFAQQQAGRAGDLANQIATQFGGARGDLLKALAAPTDPTNPQSPFAYAAGQPNYDPYAAFRLAQTTPEAAAQAAQAQAQAKLASTQAEVQGLRLKGDQGANAYGGAGATPAGGGARPAGAIPTNPPAQPLMPTTGHNTPSDTELDSFLNNPQAPDYAEKLAAYEKNPIVRAKLIQRARARLAPGAASPAPSAAPTGAAPAQVPAGP